MSKEIIDSKLSRQEALAASPDSSCPDEIIRTLGLMKVEYYGFDKKRHIGQIVISKNVMAEVEAFFKHALQIKFPIEKVVVAADQRYKWDDERLMADNASSGFNYRKIAGSGVISKHGRGLAFDINPRQNPYIRYEDEEMIVQPPNSVWDKENPGTLYDGHPLTRLMEGFGWEWGGNWEPESGRVDYQHLEKA